LAQKWGWQTQTNPIQTQFRLKNQGGKANLKPIQSQFYPRFDPCRGSGVESNRKKAKKYESSVFVEWNQKNLWLYKSLEFASQKVYYFRVGSKLYSQKIQVQYG